MDRLPDDIGLDASVVADIPSLSGLDTGMVAVIRQLHGGGEFKHVLVANEELSTSFIEHHNQIRSLCVRLLSLDPAYFMETMRLPLQTNLECGFGRRILGFERRNAVSDVGTAIRSQLRPLFTDEQWTYLQGEAWDIDDYDAIMEFADGEFLNGYLDLIQGSFRHAAWMIANGMKCDVPCWELDPWESVPGIPDSDSDWSLEQKRLFDEVRIDALASGVHAHRPAGTSVVVMGSSHTRSGAPSPAMPQIRYFEDALPEKLPDHRIVVLETHAKPWMMVNWAKED